MVLFVFFSVLVRRGWGWGSWKKVISHICVHESQFESKSDNSYGDCLLLLPPL